MVRNLSLDFAARGHDCQIVALSAAGDVGNSTEFERHFQDDLVRSGVRWDILERPARQNPIVGGLQLRRVLQSFGPDVLHVHTPYALLARAIAGLRVPTLYTHHNSILQFHPSLFRIFDRVVSRYVAICRACELVLKAHARRPIELIRNGVPDAFVRAGARERLAENPTVLSVGAVTRQKDYPTLIKAAGLCRERLGANGRRIVFQLVGSGSEDGSIRQQVRDSGLNGVVKLLGTRSDVAELMAAADLMVNSSLYEGLPIALIEAAQSGLPTVATAVGGNSEIVEDQRSGLLVPPGEPSLLAEAIEDILTDPEKYVLFSREAKARGASFSLNACASQHLRLYGEVIAAHPRRGS